MKNIFIQIKIVLFLCVSYSYAQNEDLKIEIVNTEVLSRENIGFTKRNFYKGDTVGYLVTNEYDSIPQNKINLKITNEGTKPFVLLLTHNFSGYPWTNKVTFEITDNKNQIQNADNACVVTESMQAYDVRRSIYDREQAKLKKELFDEHYKDTLDLNKIEFNQSFNYLIIHPNEVKYFTFYQGLPFFRFENPFYYMYFLNTTKNYYFQVVIRNAPELIKSFLYENQLKEIEENGYILFDGELKSNKVPIMFVKM